MATIRREFKLASSPSAAWEAFRDVGAVHQRLARGFVTNTVLDGDSRLVTFANGMTVRERIVTVDDAARRIAYAIVGGQTTHHNASFEVLGDGGGSRVVWTVDLLPDAMAGPMAGMMEQGCEAMKRTIR